MRGPSGCRLLTACLSAFGVARHVVLLKTVRSTPQTFVHVQPFPNTSEERVMFIVVLARTRDITFAIAVHVRDKWRTPSKKDRRVRVVPRDSGERDGMRTLAKREAHLVHQRSDAA